MTRPLTVSRKFDLDLAFTFEAFESGTKCHLWIGKIFIMNVVSSNQNLPNIHQLGQLVKVTAAIDIFNSNQWHAP